MHSNGSYNVVLSDTVCRIPKLVMDAEGRLAAHAMHSKCAQIYGPVWFSLLSLYNRLRLHIVLVGFEPIATTVILWTIFYTCPTCEWVVPLFWKMCCLKFNFIYHRLLKNEKQNNNPLRHLVLRRSWRYLHTHTQHTHTPTTQPRWTQKIRAVNLFSSHSSWLPKHFSTYH